VANTSANNCRGSNHSTRFTAYRKPSALPKKIIFPDIAGDETIGPSV
jgi:hypothetical protein